MSDEPGFTWGTIAGATPVEGAAPRADWARWERLGRVPPSGDGNGFATTYRDDLALLAGHGVARHVLTLDWARLEPSPGRLDGGAVEHAREVLQVAREIGVEPWVCLHDGPLPGWFADEEGGFTDDRARGTHWARHVDRAGEAFADLAAGWVPMRAPLAYAIAGWLTGRRPPGRTDPEAFTGAVRASVLATFEAWRLLRSGDQPVMGVVELGVVRARAHGEPDERARAQRWASWWDRLTWGLWGQALGAGLLDVPGRASEEHAAWAGAFDVLAVDFHGGATVGADGVPAADAPGAWPEVLGPVLHRAGEVFPRHPLVVAGCAVATTDPTLDDDERASALAGCLDALDRARDDGIDVVGFLSGGVIDGYEWEHGFDRSTGLFDRARRPRSSAAAFADRARA